MRRLDAYATAPSLGLESARDFGDVWALTELWNSLGFHGLRRVFRRTRHAIDVEALIRVMVLNHLCDPDTTPSYRSTTYAFNCRTRVGSLTSGPR